MNRTRLHDLLDIVVIAICATICNANSWEDIWRMGVAKRDLWKKYLRLPNGIPSADTFARVFQRLDPDEFLRSFSAWTDTLCGDRTGEIVALDGQTLRGSGEKDRHPLHLVRAFATSNRLVLGQVGCDEKSNEITAIPELLKMLEISGAIVTIDAMGCQTEIAQKILDRDADYVLHVKGNQPKLHDAVREEFESAFVDALGGEPPRFRQHTTHETEHGRDEHRDYYMLPAPKTVPTVVRWPGVKSLGMVVRTRTVNGAESIEISYYISSLPVGVRRFAKAVRAHWAIENTLHWSLDVTFQQDASRIRKGHSPQLASTLRQLALTVLQHDPVLCSQCKTIKGRRQKAGWNDDVLVHLLTNV